jgi:tetratricopeptide (TPR) repeat protein
LHAGWVLNNDANKQIAWFQECATRYPFNPLAHHYLGGAYATHGRFEDAIKCYDKALELKPDHLPSMGEKGLALWHLGKLPEAIWLLEKVLEVVPAMMPYSNVIYEIKAALKQKQMEIEVPISTIPWIQFIQREF